MMRLPPSILSLFACTLFTLPLAAHVQLDGPGGGEHFGPGQTVTIRWHVLIQHSTTGWNLEYSLGGAAGPWLPIAMNLPAGAISAGSMHSFQWTTPRVSSATVRVRVTQVNFGRNYESMSARDFAIGARLHADTYTLSGPTGGTQNLQVDVGSAFAMQGYVVAGSLSGTSPGFMVNGHLVPLVRDAWFDWTLANPNGGPLHDGAGQLDPLGRADARLTLPPLPVPLAAPVTAHHAAAVIDPLGQLLLVTPPVPLEITP